MTTVNVSAPLNNTPASHVIRQQLCNKMIKNVFNYCHLNCRSLVAHANELNSIFSGLDIQCIALTETWLKSSHTNKSVDIDGFNIFRCDRLKKGAVVLLYYYIKA